jgi:hypothetical protein
MAHVSLIAVTTVLLKKGNAVSAPAEMVVYPHEPA